MDFETYWAKRNQTGTWGQKSEETRHKLTWEAARLGLKRAAAAPLGKIEAVFSTLARAGDEHAAEGLEAVRKIQEGNS